MRRVLGCLGILASGFCTSCFTSGGQSGTEADDLGGNHGATVDAGTTVTVSSATTSGETNHGEAGPDASVSGVTDDDADGETTSGDETARDTSADERGLTLPGPRDTSSDRATSDDTAISDNRATSESPATSDNRATSDDVTVSSGDEGATSSSETDRQVTDNEEAYVYNAPFDPQRQIAQLPPPRTSVVHDPGDCVVVSVDEVAAECSARQVCEGNTFTVSCFAGAYGNMCNLMDKFGQLVLAPTDLTPGMCETLLEDYKNGDISRDELSCSAPVAKNYDYGMCGIEQACVDEITVGSLTLSEARSRQVTCYPLDVGGYDCSCGGESFTTYHLEQTDSADACNQVLELCASGQDPMPFVNAPSCGLTSETRTKDSCHVTSECSYEHSLGDGATQTAKADHTVQCENVSLHGAWNCDCSKGLDVVKVEIPDDSLDSRVCGQIDEPCRSVYPTTVFSDALCVPTGQSNFGGDCQVTFDCQRDFDLNGIDAVISTPLYVGCTLEDPRLGWQCDCKGAEDLTFTVQAEDASGACAAAAAPCQQYQQQLAQDALAR